MKLSKQYVPAVLGMFKNEVEPFKGATPTPERIVLASNLIAAYAQRLQILDLSLSEADARELLKQAYQSI